MRPWHALAAALLVGVAVALFLHFRNSESEHTDRFSDPIRQDFYYSGMVTCTATARENPAIIEVGASEADIHAYCDCAMSETAEAFTMEEMMFIEEHNDFPDSAHEKLHAIMTTCGQTHLN